MPGWREQVEPLRQDSMFWNSIWVSLSCANSGNLFELKKHVRNKYHYAIMKCKAASDATRLQKLLEASQSGYAHLLREMKSIKGGRKQHSTVTEHLDGVDGREAISEKFKNVYDALYNSAGSSDEMNELRRS